MTETIVTAHRRPLDLWQLGLAAVLRLGELVIGLPDGTDHVFRGRDHRTSARVDVRDTAFARRLLHVADIGLADGYIEGQWDTPDLHAVIELGLANLSARWIAGVAGRASAVPATLASGIRQRPQARLETQHRVLLRSRQPLIQRYVFPGSMLPSIERFKRSAIAAGLSVGAPYTFGQDYARTLHDWAERFERVVPQVRASGYNERFVRMWRCYLTYCEVGFESGHIDVMQIRIDGAR